jgi:4-hydroxybenzoate polyprenyltransferase
VSAPAPRGPAAELGRYLEIQTLGLNLAFAVAFMLLAAHGLPSLLPVVLIVVAFIGARNAGHSFNRWADRAFDAANPRTQDRALVTGRYSSNFALAFALGNGTVLVVAAGLLNPLAFYLSFVALALIFGYSFTKRFTAWTTPFLGLVEAITPGAVFIALRGTLPLEVLLAVGGMLLWGTAFETIHSLGDLESDRALGLRSLPIRIGAARSLDLIPVLHAAALGLLAAFGATLGLPAPYYAGLLAMAVVAALTDLGLRRARASPRSAFRRHFLMSSLYLAGTVAALWLPVVYFVPHI